MAARKISSTTTDFRIPVQSGRPSSKEIVIKLPQRGKYDVYQKDFPALPDGVTWINNFGLKVRPKKPNQPDQTEDTTDSDPFPPTVDEYIIEMDDKAGSRPVYLDGSTIKDFDASKLRRLPNNRIQVSLNLGDPPTGYIP